MLQETIDLYNDTILDEALVRFDILKENTKALDGFESFVYDCIKNNQSYILKVTHSNRRTVDSIMGELNFVNYLAARGVPTSQAVVSSSGNFVESISDNNGGQFHAYLFEKSPGELSKPKEWDDALISQWGKISGMMNRLSSEYTPAQPSYRRQDWYQDDIYNFEKHIAPENKHIADLCQKIVDRIKAIPQTNKNYGLIHGDMHHGNFFVNKNKPHICVFDFDDSEHCYYFNDIAVPLYYAAPGPDDDYGGDRAEFSEYFLSQFIPAYQKEFPIERFFFEKMHDFLLLRTVTMYSLFSHRTFRGDWNERIPEFLNRFGRRIEGKEKVIDLDFVKLGKKLL